MGRREFMFGVFTNPANRPHAESREVGGQPEVKIGRIADFPIGENKKLYAHSIVVESLPEGLRARSLENGDRYCAIRSNQIGELMVDRAVTWSANRVFSILTNGPTCLNTSLEEE